MLLFAVSTVLAVPQMSAGELAALAAPPRVTADARHRVEPDADGVFDLAAAVAAANAEPVPNPFRIRLTPQFEPRTLNLQIAGVACPEGDPAEACCVLNGETCSPGDTIGGLTIASIGIATIDLTRGRFLMRIPVDRSVSIRLPR